MLEDAQQIGQGPPQAIHRPRSHHVEFPGIHRLEHGVEARAAVTALGAADAGIFIDLDDLPARPRFRGRFLKRGVDTYYRALAKEMKDRGGVFACLSFAFRNPLPASVR